MSMRQLYETAFDSAVTPASDTDYLDKLAQSPLVCGSALDFTQESSSQSSSTRPKRLQNFNTHRPWTIGPKHDGKPSWFLPKTYQDSRKYPLPFRPHSDPLDRRKADPSLQGIHSTSDPSTIAENKSSKSDHVFHLPLEQSFVADNASKTFSPSTEFKKLEVGEVKGNSENSQSGSSLFEKPTNPKQLCKIESIVIKDQLKVKPFTFDAIKPHCEKNTTDTKSIRDDIKRNHEDTGTGTRVKLSLDFNQPVKKRRRNILDYWTPGHNSCHEIVDPSIELEKQGWYHGSINHRDAEKVLRLLKKGSFLVRCCKTPQQNYSLSIKSANGVMHMKISQSSGGRFLLKHQSQSFDSIPAMVYHFCINPLPVYGLEHVVLKSPVINQLL